eukprot:6312321-Pyramimonas_sp.AAC.1
MGRPCSASTMSRTSSAMRACESARRGNAGQREADLRRTEGVRLALGRSRPSIATPRNQVSHELPAACLANADCPPGNHQTANRRANREANKDGAGFERLGAKS